MLWLSVLESIPSQWKRKVKSHDMKIVDDVSAGPSLNMTVKSVYNILLRSVKTCPTAQKSIETLLNSYSINWPEVYMIPHKVTIETSLRVFQYKLLNNIIYLNKRIAQFDSAVNPLCSLCSQAPEDVVHLFCHCQETRQLWELLRSMLQGHITLPDPEPTLAVVGKWCIENNNNLIIVLIFKKFLYDNRSNHSRIHIAALKYQLRLAEKIEQKIASEKGKMEFHLKKWDPILQALQSIFFPLPRNKNKGRGKSSRLGGVGHTFEHFHDAPFFAFVLVWW